MKMDNRENDNIDIMEDNTATDDVKAECDNILMKMTQMLGYEP